MGEGRAVCICACVYLLVCMATVHASLIINALATWQQFLGEVLKKKLL